MFVRYDNIALSYTRLGWILVALSVGALSVAAYLQQAWSLYPCSLCIAQRYAFMFIGLAGALLCAGRPGLRMPGLLLTLVASLGGLFVAGRNVWVQVYPSPSCGMDAFAAFLNGLPWVPMWPGMFEASGMCSDPIPDVLGVSFPVWALLGFVLCLGLVGRRLYLRKERSNTAELPIVSSKYPC